MHWCAVNTKPHQEGQAEQNLRRLGLETFSPQLKKRKVVRRRLQTVIGPLFPGYLFARVDQGEHLRSISYARGVRRIVAFGSTPAILDDELIESIRRRVQDGYIVLSNKTLKPGQLVSITDGPLCGLEAVFEREMTDQQRVVLLLRTLAYQARVVLPFDQVANI